MASAAEPTWYDLPTPDSLPGLAAGPDGTTWVANLASAEIDRIDPAGTHSPIGLEFGVDPFAIVRGPDGAMWFTENGGNRIGRLSVDGELSEYFLRDHSIPTGITVGPDGALQFAQRGVSSIGRTTVDGEITEWPTISTRAAPSITTGSDGDLVHLDLGKRDRPDHGRRCDDGAAAPSALAHAAVDHDGSRRRALVHGARHEHDRAPHGRRRTHRVRGPHRGLRPERDHGGPDGALWFTEERPTRSATEPGGAVSEIPLGEGAAPTGIRPGPDGAIWFSASGTNRVGRLDAVVEVHDRRRRRSRSHRRPTARC